MNDGGWIPIDKRLTHFLPRNRSYTILEAAFSFSKDIDEGKEKAIIEYARIWSWSRTKVRRFVSDLKTGTGHTPDRDETGVRQEIRLINNTLKEIKDRGKTGAKQVKNSLETGTIILDPKPEPKTKTKGLKPSVVSLPSWIPKDAWDLYLKNRIKIKKPLMEDAWHLAFMKLEKLKEAGHEPEAVLNQSSLNGWQGLFEIKEQTGKSGDRPRSFREQVNRAAGDAFERGEY